MSKRKEIKFRLTEDEMEKAQKDSERYEMTVNALAKFMVLNLSLPESPDKAIAYKKLNGQVGAIGNNLNQIARKVNQNNSFTKSERDEIRKALNEIRNNTLELLGREPVEEIEINEPSKTIPKFRI